MEALKGIDFILLYRLLKKETQEAAWKMAFQTEHENGLSRDSDSTVQISTKLLITKHMCLNLLHQLLQRITLN